MRRVYAVVLIAMAVLALLAVAQQGGTPAAKPQAEHKMTPLKVSPDFERLRSLAGRWEGTSPEGTVVSTFQVTADGSAVMNMLAPGTQYEMLTVFHPDGDNIMGTHYCAAHNQPRLVATPSKDPKVLTFKFKDATNLSSPNDTHIEGLVITFTDADHHTQEWTSRENGKVSSPGLIMQLTRKK